MKYVPAKRIVIPFGVHPESFDFVPYLTSDLYTYAKEMKRFFYDVAVKIKDSSQSTMADRRCVLSDILRDNGCEDDLVHNWIDGDSIGVCRAIVVQYERHYGVKK